MSQPSSAHFLKAREPTVAMGADRLSRARLAAPVPGSRAAAGALASLIGNRAFGALIAREGDRASQWLPGSRAAAGALASLIGNRAFGALIAREGDRASPSGFVHRDADTVIAARRGRGRPAGELARSVAARASITGSDVYFASGGSAASVLDGTDCSHALPTLQRATETRVAIASLARPSMRLLQRDAGSYAYDQGYQDGVSGQEPSPGPLSEDGLADYDAGYQKGRYESDRQNQSTPSPPTPEPLDADVVEPSQASLGPLLVGATALGQVTKFSAVAGETAVVGEAGVTSGVFAVGTGATVGSTEVATGTTIALSSQAAPAAAAGFAVGTVLAFIGVAVLIGGTAVWLTRVASDPQGPDESGGTLPPGGTPTPAPAAGHALPQPPVPSEPELVPEASSGKKPWQAQVTPPTQPAGDPWEEYDPTKEKDDPSCDGPLYRMYPKCSRRRFESKDKAFEDIRKNYRGLENATEGNARRAKELGPFVTNHVGVYETPAKKKYEGTVFKQECCEDVNGQAQIISVWTHNLSAS